MDPTRGAVFLDGVDLRDLDPEWLRRQIGFVPQETFLFSATLAENIAWGVDDATAGRHRSAPRNSPASRPTSPASRMATAPSSASAASRYPAARSSASPSRAPSCAIRKILILDDALASVDTLTEERILEGLAGVMRGRTTILISHRVSTVQNASQIFVIEHGEVAEQGTHAELIRSGGYYADLYQKQLLEEELETI